MSWQHKGVWIFALFIGIMALAVLLGSGSTVTLAGSQVLPLPGSDFNLISEAQEIEIGNTRAKDIEKENTLVTDAAVQAYLDGLGSRLARNSPRANMKYEFRLMNVDAVNAESIPGHVYVYKGLIAAADNEPELAGVLGHELGHIAGRHSVKQLSQKQVMGGLLGTAGSVLGLASSNLEDLFRGVGGASAFLISQKYSRDQEREADSTGLGIVVRTGLDPNGMVRFFRKLAAGRGANDADMLLFQS